MEDETQAKPLDLLARYRLLCEQAGAARATDTPLPREIREQLARVEAELQTRLWLASTESSARRPEKPARPQGASPSQPPASKVGPADPDLGPRPNPTGATVYCDGACLGNPGPGGYGVLVRVPGHADRTLSEGKPRTTNNEMELTGAVAGLRLAISLGAREVSVVSDSEYLVKGMSGWVRGWLRNGWKTAKGEPVKNRALWEELHNLCQGRSVSWSWTRGHNGHLENERCDALATAAAQEAAGRSRR